MTKETLKKAFEEAELYLGDLEYYYGANTMDYGEFGIVDDPKFTMRADGVYEILRYDGEEIARWIIDEETDMAYHLLPETLDMLTGFAYDNGLDIDDVESIFSELKRK